MIEMFKEIDWAEYIELFTYGNPPVWMQMVIFNGLVFAFIIAKHVIRAKPVSKGKALFRKVLYIAINGLILSQEFLGIQDTISDLWGNLG